MFTRVLLCLVLLSSCAEHDHAPLDAPQEPELPLPPLPSLPRLPSPELPPAPDEEPYTWADFCSATTEIQMQRVRGPHIVPVGTLPVYDDPTDPLVYDPGHFQKDPLQAPTALTPDWANMVQQELCNLIEALGGTLDGENDRQLAELFTLQFNSQLRHVYTPDFTAGLATATETRVAVGMSGFEDNANNQVDARAAGVTMVSGYLPPYPSFILLLLNAAASNGCRIYTGNTQQAGNGIIAVLNDIEFSAQWEANLGSVGGTAVGANGADIYMGLHSDADAVGSSGFDNGAAHSFVMFRKLATDTTWKCRVGDGAAATTVDSGVAPVEDVPQIFRIEYFGSNSPRATGGAATAKFYIDGVKVADINDANVPSGATALGLSYQMYATATGPDANLGLVLSPISTTSNVR